MADIKETDGSYPDNNTRMKDDAEMESLGTVNMTEADYKESDDVENAIAEGEY